MTAPPFRMLEATVAGADGVKCSVKDIAAGEKLAEAVSQFVEQIEILEKRRFSFAHLELTPRGGTLTIHRGKGEDTPPAAQLEWVEPTRDYELSWHSSTFRADGGVADNFDEAGEDEEIVDQIRDAGLPTGFAATFGLQ